MSIKKWLCLCISALILVSGTVVASAYTTDDVVDAALDLIYNHEGIYTSVLPNDNGAVSLGRVGWHGSRALNLLKTIVNADRQQAQELLGDELYNEILTATSWNTRIFTVQEAAAAATLLATQESRQAQDNLAAVDIRSYITHGQTLGITDGKALVFFADMENQCGSGISGRVAEAAIATVSAPSAVTLSVLYTAALADRTAGSSPSRRRSAYEYANALDLDNNNSSTYRTGSYTVRTNDGSSPLRLRSGAGTGYSQLGTVPYGTRVTVTEVSGTWGRITYGGRTGWISLLYTVYNAPASTTTGGESITYPESSIRGDLNGNGSVDSDDARLALRASASLGTLTQSQRAMGDIDGDSRVTASDARRILRAAARLQSL